MSRRFLGLVFAALIGAGLGCTRPLTEVLIVVDTDFAVPGGLDSINVEVVSPSGEPLRAMGPVSS